MKSNLESAADSVPDEFHDESTWEQILQILEERGMEAMEERTATKNTTIEQSRLVK